MSVATPIYHAETNRMATAILRAAHNDPSLSASQLKQIGALAADPVRLECRPAGTRQMSGRTVNVLACRPITTTEQTMDTSTLPRDTKTIYAAIQARAFATRQPGESDAMAVDRFVQTEEGAALWLTYRRASRASQAR